MTRLKKIGTKSGRFSSSTPNISNLPREAYQATPDLIPDYLPTDFLLYEAAYPGEDGIGADVRQVPTEDVPEDEPADPKKRPRNLYCYCGGYWCPGDCDPEEGDK